MTFCRWQTATSAQICVTTTVHTNALSATAIFRKPLTDRLIQITRDGKITDDEIKDFALISKKLNDISLAVDALNLWVDKTTSENNINIKLLNEEMQKLNQ